MALLSAVATVCSALGQVTVEVDTEQDQFLPHERLPVTVRIINFSGQTLHLGKGSEWLQFTIETRGGSIVQKAGVVPVEEEFELPSSKTASKTVNLEPYYELAKTGQYKISASVQFDELGRSVQSKPTTVTIIPGTKLWSLDFGIPVSPDGAASETRRYALLQANYLRQLKLYVRVSDIAEQLVYDVYPVGPLVSFSSPVAQVDRASNLHVLYQSSARNFTYFMVDPEAKLLVRQTYQMTASRPALRPDTAGRIRVVGGARRLSPTDINPPLADVSVEEKQTLAK